MGVKKGVSDFFFAKPCGSKHGLFIELKRTKGGRVSDEQESWIKLARSLGYEAEVCYGCDEAISLVKSYVTP